MVTGTVRAVPAIACHAATEPERERLQTGDGKTAVPRLYCFMFLPLAMRNHEPWRGDRRLAMTVIAEISTPPAR